MKLDGPYNTLHIIIFASTNEIKMNNFDKH